MVTRLAPSPTGFVHLGSLDCGFIDRIMASQSGGICYLRIEDTDTKRTVDNGIGMIIDSLNKFDITLMRELLRMVKLAIMDLIFKVKEEIFIKLLLKN